MVARQLPKLKTRVRFPSPAPRLRLMLHKDALITYTFDWYLRNVLPIVSQNAIQQKYGYHGLYTHTAAVVFRGIDYALALDKDPKPVVLACAFHDIARTNDGPDMMHGENAIPIVSKIFREHLPIPTNYAESIISAVKNHTTGTVAPDYISACLWDADRTRLSWEWGFEERFFATLRAKQVAAANGDDYVAFMVNQMSEYARGIITQFGTQY